MEQEKTKMEAMLRSILDEILESKLTAILSSILDAKLKTYEESMNFYNTKFETVKGKMEVTLHNALLMYNYHHNLLPSSFENFFKTVASIHSYNTRLASKSTYYLNTIKTNYGKFNFRFAAVKVWNNLDESIKHLKVMSNILQSYCS